MLPPFTPLLESEIRELSAEIKNNVLFSYFWPNLQNAPTVGVLEAFIRPLARISAFKTLFLSQINRLGGGEGGVHCPLCPPDKKSLKRQAKETKIGKMQKKRQKRQP